MAQKSLQKMPVWGGTSWGKCQFGEVSVWGSDSLGKCQFEEVSVWGSEMNMRKI